MPKPDYLTPQQQLALLTLRRSELSELVVRHLLRSTVRHSRADCEAMIPLGLVKRTIDGRHALLPHGHVKANILAREFAEQFGIALPSRPARPIARPGGVRRIDLMSDSGNA